MQILFSILLCSQYIILFFTRFFTREAPRSIKRNSNSTGEYFLLNDLLLTRTGFSWLLRYLMMLLSITYTLNFRHFQKRSTKPKSLCHYHSVTVTNSTLFVNAIPFTTVTWQDPNSINEATRAVLNNLGL